MYITGYNLRIIDTFENDRVLAEERTQKGNPVLQYSGADDKYQQIMASELDFNFEVPGAADGAFFHLYSGNDTRYRVELYDQDNNLLWVGFLMPDQYVEPYQHVRYFVSMTATDGLGRLKGKTLSYQYYNGEYSVMKLMAECLKLTGLTQVINFAPAIQPVNNYRWDEIAVDTTTYRDDTNPTGVFGNKLPKRKNAYEILELLAGSIGCTVFAWGGQWYIIGINRKHEAVSAIEKYNANGVFMGNDTLVRNVVAPGSFKFQANPNITVLSPWGKVTVTWQIKEDGNLLPDNAITEDPDKWHIDTGNAIIDGANHGLPNEDPLKNWQKFGSITASVGSRGGQNLIDGTVAGSILFPQPIGPYNLLVGKTYGTGSAATGETASGTYLNWIQLKKPKYIKVSDEYIYRSLSVKVGMYGQGGTRELVDGNTLQDIYRAGITVTRPNVPFPTDSVVVENRPGAIGYENFKYKLDFSEGAIETVSGTSPTGLDKWNQTPAQVTGSLEKDGIEVHTNGFLNIKLYGPVSPHPAHPVFYNYVLTNLELLYTAQDEWYDELVRDIDFTTLYELDIYHGDSIQDLSKNQWRFRRPVPFTASITDIYVSAIEVQTVVSTVYILYISYQQAQLILQNSAQLKVTYAGITYAVNDLYPNPETAFGNGMLFTGAYWNVIQNLTGAWAVTLQAVAHPSGIFDDPNNFNDMFLDIDTSGAVLGYVPEDNEQRESWKRYGHDENRRFGLCMGRMYHDVQPEPLAKVDGTALAIFSPLELISFHWMEQRLFMPTSLRAIRFSEGLTDIAMIETKIQDINDYILYGV